MGDNSFDLVQSFVEDCREHLDSIESALMDIEAAGGHQNPELVNSVFRLAHSIKGGAGMLGLDNIKTLAHKLENVLHMVRSKELFPGHAVVDVLLKGFDRLTALVDNVHESEAMPIDAWVNQLLALSAPGQEQGVQDDQPVGVDIGARTLFNVDALSLKQAQSGGNELYLLQFDLIHDIHGKGRMPFDLLKTLTDTGRIVDCMVDLSAVGDLDDFANRIPFYVLFATILEPKYVSGLVKLPDEQVRHIDDLPEHTVIARQTPAQTAFGRIALRMEGEGGRIVLPQDMTDDALADLHKALVAGRERCAGLVLDWSAVVRADLFFLQLVLGAGLDFAQHSKRLAASGPMPEDLRRACVVQGLGDASQPGCLLPLA
jgi:HPt (histidine-containing phosphotransfer) domain-containing protein